MPTIINTGPLTLAGLHSTDEVTATTLPVDLSTATYRTMLRIDVPVDAGDILDVDARARVTNDCGYTVGVGYHLWGYDSELPVPVAQRPWWKIGPDNGDNVTPQRHHMPLHITACYQMPADWPVGHRMCVVLRADAHSTAWKPGDTLTVDREYGLLVVRRWKPVS